MARTNKKGLDYFPFDVDFFQDIKIRKLIKYQGGGKAVAVYALLLCTIYKHGYYIRWDKELPFIISEQTGYTEAYIQEVITCCLNIGLFSKELFEKEEILTSKGIQLRYKTVCNRRNSVISEYNLTEEVVSDSGCQTTSSIRVPVNDPPKGQRPIQQDKEVYNKTVQEEVLTLKSSEPWLAEVCKRYSLPAEKITSYLEDFALVCPNRHTSLQDCQSHFCRWLAKKNTSPKVSKAIEAEVEREKERERRKEEERKHKASVVHPDEFLRSKGFKPGTNMAEIARLQAAASKDQLPEDVRSALDRIKGM